MFKKIANKAKSAVCSVKAAVMSRKAEGYVDSGVKILIAVVIGALILTLLYALFNDIIMPTVAARVIELFSYAG